MKNTRLMICGDLVITDDNYSKNKIDNQIIELFTSSDWNIANLESPVTTSSKKILKTGPHLKANQKSTKEVLKTIRIDMVTLANNHVLDYGEHGVLDTLSFCQGNKIATVGAGKDKVEAAKIFYLDSEIGKIAIINIAENEWASGTSTTAGANGMDLIDDVKKIHEAKEKSEFVFLIIHGGHEYYNLPSPRMQKQYRFYAENGADLIVGHHTHCISGNENYNGVPIFYSLGNFLFTHPSIFKDWYLGLVLEVNINSKGDLSTILHPVKQKIKSFELLLINGEEKTQVLERVNAYSMIINNEVKLEEKWQNYIDSKTQTYLNHWAPTSFFKHRYVKGILNRLKVTKLLTSKSGLALHLNLMRCEAHYDLSKEILSKRLIEK